MRILIAIPVYNEQKYVNHVLDEVLKYHPHVLVIDDGSSDNTPRLLARRGDIVCLRHPVNQGYGQSLIDAFIFASANGYDWVITMDCDEQHEPRMIPEFMKHIATDQWDIISGSRYLHSRSDDDLPPGDRRMVNACITATLNETFKWNLTDAFCGFKAHRVAAMDKLLLTEPGYAFPMQLWPEIYKKKLRLTEVPVRLIYNDPNRSFGAVLDQTHVRLRHYLDVLSRELDKKITSDCEKKNTAKSKTA